jgi:alpha-1,3-rhamnosyl/mannosyltransferase
VKVLLDVSAITLPLSGIGRYALELARHLPQAPDIEQLSYLRGDRVLGSFDPRNLEAPAPVGKFRGWIKPLLPYRLLLGPYRRRRARDLAASLRGYDDHIFYSPNFSVPPVAGLSVVTLHDLSVFHFPDFHPRDRVNYLREQIQSSAERADRLLTDSQFVRGELLQLFQLPGDRVTAIPLGVAPSFRPHTPGELAPVMAHYGLRAGGYLLSVGTIEPRKNLAGLLQAFRRLAPGLRQRYPLVIAGAYGWNSGTLMEEIRLLSRRAEVIYLDYVPEEHLPALYAGASVFSYFSFYEGFGLPVLEAMASGVPVVCAASSALPELCAGSALQADPQDIGAMASVLQRAVEDEDWRRVAIERGLARSRGFTWQSTTAALVDVFRELAA